MFFHQYFAVNEEKSVMNDEEFLEKFETLAKPLIDFHHREHLKVAYLYLRRHPLPEAMNKVRAGIIAFNNASGTPDLPDRGYHETITQCWVRIMHMTICEYGPGETADRFLDEHSQLLGKKNLRLFYSRGLIMSPRAKVEFVPPDLAPLPVARAPAAVTP